MTCGYIALFLVHIGYLNNLFEIMTHIYPINTGTVIMHSHKRYGVMAPNVFFCVKGRWRLEVYLYKDGLADVMSLAERLIN